MGGHGAARRGHGAPLPRGGRERPAGPVAAAARACRGKQQLGAGRCRRDFQQQERGGERRGGGRLRRAPAHRRAGRRGAAQVAAAQAREPQVPARDPCLRGPCVLAADRVPSAWADLSASAVSAQPPALVFPVRCAGLLCSGTGLSIWPGRMLRRAPARPVCAETRCRWRAAVWRTRPARRPGDGRNTRPGMRTCASSVCGVPTRPRQDVCVAGGAWPWPAARTTRRGMRAARVPARMTRAAKRRMRRAGCA